MEIFRVPSRTIEARVALEDGRELKGRLYVAATGPDGQPGRLLDRLNDDDERFIPFAVDVGRALLMHKRWVRTVRVDDDAGPVDVDRETDHRVTVRVTLNGGELLRGQFHYALPPDHSRLMDFLNETPRFVTLHGTGGVTLVNRDYIVCVAGLDED